MENPIPHINGGFDDEQTQLEYEMRSLELMGLVIEICPGVWALTNDALQHLEFDQPDESE